MTRFVLQRLAGMIIVLVVVAVISFAVFYLLPTNPAQLSCGPAGFTGVPVKPAGRHEISRVQ